MSLELMGLQIPLQKTEDEDESEENEADLTFGEANIDKKDESKDEQPKPSEEDGCGNIEQDNEIRFGKSANSFGIDGVESERERDQGG